MTSRLGIVAHEDDDILFCSPDLLHSIQAGDTVRTIYVTAGDAGGTSTYWQGRENGSKAAYAAMAGVTNAWTTADAGITSHPITVATLTAAPQITLVFMRLPDGNQAGQGFAAYGSQSLQHLYEGGLSSITAVDSSSSYTKTQLTATLASLITSFNPDVLYSQDHTGTFGDGDHSDHHASAFFAQDASTAAGKGTVRTYQGYGVTSRATNVAGADYTAKQSVYTTYSAYDANAAGSAIYEPYQYVTDGPGITAVTACASGPNIWVGMLLRVLVLTSAAATQNGATAGSASAGQASITTTQAGSRVYGAVTRGTNSSLTAAANTTQIDNVADATNGMRYGTVKATALTGTPGATTIGDTNGGDCSLFEVKTAGTLTEDASAPGPETSVSLTALRSVPFTPPAGSLLVALVAANDAGSAPVITVSGGGLTWVQAALTGGGNGVSAVFIAQVPAGSTNASVTPTAVACAASAVAPTVAAQRNVSISQAALALAASIPAPGVGASVSVTVTPAAIAAATAVPAPGGSAGSRAAPATASTAAALPAAIAAAGSTALPAAMTGTAVIPAPSPGAGGTVLPATAAGSTALPAPVAGAASTVMPAAIDTATALPAPGGSAGSAATPAAMQASVSVPVPGISAGGSASVRPAAIQSAIAMAQPLAGAGAGVTPAVTVAQLAMAAPGMSLGTMATPQTAMAALAIPAPRVRTESIAVYGSASVEGAELPLCIEDGYSLIYGSVSGKGS